MIAMAPEAGAIELPGPEFGAEERYRLYERTRDGLKQLIATCATPAAVGVALVTLAEDRWEAGDHSAPIFGVQDGELGRWVTGMYVGGGLA
jgi:hypothetical protein